MRKYNVASDGELCQVDSGNERGRQLYRDKRTLFDPNTKKDVSVPRAMNKGYQQTTRLSVPPQECLRCFEYGHYADSCPNERRTRPKRDDVDGYIAHLERNLQLAKEAKAKGVTFPAPTKNGAGASA